MSAIRKRGRALSPVVLAWLRREEQLGRKSHAVEKINQWTGGSTGWRQIRRGVAEPKFAAAIEANVALEMLTVGSESNLSQGVQLRRDFKLARERVELARVQGQQPIELLQMMISDVLYAARRAFDWGAVAEVLQEISGVTDEFEKMDTKGKGVPCLPIGFLIEAFNQINDLRYENICAMDHFATSRTAQGSPQAFTGSEKSKSTALTAKFFNRQLALVNSRRNPRRCFHGGSLRNIALFHAHIGELGPAHEHLRTAVNLTREANHGQLPLHSRAAHVEIGLVTCAHGNGKGNDSKHYVEHTEELFRCLRQANHEAGGDVRPQVRSRGLAPKTANRYREILTRLFNWATTQHGIRMPSEKNPAAAVERYKEHAPEISFLTLEQIDEQLDALGGDVKMQAAVATLIFAGLRREELLWLTAEDVDLAAGSHGHVRVRAKTVGGESWQPKTKKNRGVPVSSRLRPYLDKWLMKRPKGTPWLFPNTAGGRYDPDNFSGDLRTLNAAKGLDWTNLDYRHTFGSQLAMKGESLYKIATLMGNSPEICCRHYAALMPESLMDSVEFGPPVASTTANPPAAIAS